MIRNYKYEYETLCEDIKRDIIDNLRAYHNGFYRFTLEDKVRVPYAIGTPLISEITVIGNDIAFKTALYTCCGTLVCESKEFIIMENNFKLLIEIFEKIN